MSPKLCFAGVDGLRALIPVRTVKNTRTRFRRPADFSIARHLGDSFGVFKGKARYRVRIRFDAFASQLVAERYWHPTQRIARLADGELRAEPERCS